MTTKLIILTVLGAVVLAALAYMIVRAWRYRRNHPDEDPGASRHQLLLLLMLLLAPAGAWAQSTWTVTSRIGVKDTFIVTRSSTTIAETVLYRTVGLSAYAGQHYTATNGTLTFGVGENVKKVAVTRANPNDNAYLYQNGTERSYRFEVTDQGGFYLSHCTRSLSSGYSVPSSGIFAQKTVIINSGETTASDAGYINNPYLSVAGTSYYDNAAPKNWLSAIGATLHMTLSMDVKEVNDGYQYVQLLFDNTSSCDDRSNCSDGNPGNISLSRYMAGFGHHPGSYDGNWSNYIFPVTSQGNNCGQVDNPWGNSISCKLYDQKFKNNSYRDSDGKLIIPTSFTTLVLRLNASGDNQDSWTCKNVTAYIQAVDATAPTKLEVSVAPGRHSLGDTLYVSVAFSEIVVKTGTPTLSTNWGSLSYFSGSGSNVLTFRGIIPAGASGSLNVTGLSGTVKDLAGNSVSGGVTANGLCSLDANFAFPITYDLAGGTASNPATYTWATGSFTLTNPTRTGYTFAGWTGTGLNGPTMTVTVLPHSHGDRYYTATWTPTVYNLTYDLAGGSLATPNPTTYTIETPDFTLVNPTRANHIFLGWTGTDLASPTMSVTVAQGSIGDRSYTATWHPLWGIASGADGSAEHPYLIAATIDLDSLAARVGRGTSYSGTYFSQTADITYDGSVNNYTPVGRLSSNPFGGTYDGGGHTISGINITRNNNEQIQAQDYGLFGRIVATATVQNITLASTTITAYNNVGGIVGYNDGGIVQNCRVESTVTIKANRDYAYYHGGIVGYNSGTIKGCLCAATLSNNGRNSCYYHGGITGDHHAGNIQNCLFTGPTPLAYSSKGSIAGSKNNNAYLSNNYYTVSTLGGVNGDDIANARKARTVILGTNISLAGTVTAYSVSGLTAIGFNALRLSDGTLYSGATQSLTLTYTGDIPTGYHVVFSYNDGSDHTLAGNTLTVPTADTIHVSSSFEATTYTISYDLAGGSVATPNPTSYTVESTDITLVNPTRDGYTFAGWTGTDLVEPTTTVTIAQGSTGNRTYTATWTPIVYTISYNLAGGSASNPTSYTIETTTFTLANPTREGYTFAGWTGTGLDEPTMSVTIAQGSTGDRSYTATWTPTVYTISYNLAGGSATNPTSYTIESTTFTLANPTRDGYTFAGWTGTGLAEPTTTVTIAQCSTGDRSYTATWNIIDYTISYDLAGGNVATPNPTSYTAESDDITLVNPTRDGYLFVGWTGTGLDAATQSVTIAQGSTGNRTYTATWVIGYSITYDLAGGSVATPNPYYYTPESDDITLVNPTRDGYTFAGWTGTGLASPTMTVTIAQGSTGDRSYTATWTPTVYNLTYDLAGGSASNPASYTIESTTFTLANPTREGYIFAGWTGTGLNAATQSVTIAQGSTGNRSYTATWTPIVYSISYNLAGGSVATPNPTSYTIESNNITLVNPTREGYIFAGWTGTDLNAATQTVIIAQGSTGDRTYTANWNFDWGDWGDADHDGTTAERAYIINTTDDLDLLASRVNAGNSYIGTFFKLGANLAYSHTSDWNNTSATENNYTAIGTSSHPFSGTFDGCGHTVSGIRIYISTTSSHQGLFGYVSGGTVKNLTVADTRISGYEYCGGVVGRNNGTVENCHATATVAVYASRTSADYHGGIVGQNNSGCLVDGCTSSATVNYNDYTFSDYYGGVVGRNVGTVSRCLAIGAVVNSFEYQDPVAYNNGGTVTNCHYRNCTVNNASQSNLNTIAAGTDVTVTPTGNATVAFPYGGLQLYGSSLFSFGGTLFVPQGSTISLNLTYTGSNPLFLGFCTSDGTLVGSTNPYSLTMPNNNADVTILPLLAQTIPYSYGFENSDSWNYWNSFSGSNGIYNGSYYSHSGSYYLLFRGSTSNIVVLPPFNAATSSLRLSFWSRPESYYNDRCGTFSVGYLTDPDDTATFVALRTYTYNDWTSNNYSRKEVNFEGVLPDNARIAFRHNPTTNNYFWYVDDVEVTAHDCFPSEELVVSNIGVTAATFSWLAATGTQWEYAIKANVAANYTPTEADFTGSYTASQSGTQTITISTLTELTSYTFFLRRACDEQNKSEAESVRFSTRMTPTAVPYSNDFESSNGWSLENGDLTNQWVWGTAAHDDGTKALYISNDGGLTNAYSGGNTTVYAWKTFSFEGGHYSFSYDWRAMGYGSDDYLRVALVPDEIELTAAENAPSGFWSSGLPDGWIALDGGYCLNGSSDWRHFTIDTITLAAGNYKMVFVWTNGYYEYFLLPAAVDNVRIVQYKTFVTAGNWNDASNWNPAGVPAAGESVFIEAAADIPNGYVALCDQVHIPDYSIGSVTIADGGQLMSNSWIPVTVQKAVVAGQWNGISGMYNVYDLSPLTTDAEYDLFRYDEENAKWINQKAGGFNDLYSGRGHIYRRAANATIGLETYNYTGGNGVYYHARCSDAALRGFNFIGNLCTHDVYFGTGITVESGSIAQGFYTLNADGTWRAHTTADPIHVAEAFLIQVTTDETLLRFNSTNAAPAPSKAEQAVTLAFTVKGNGHEDVAYAMLNDEGGMMNDEQAAAGNSSLIIHHSSLSKMPHLNAAAPSLSIDGYAMATLDEETKAFPLILKAQPGEYTLGAQTASSATIGYCHLIDKLAGIDIDLPGETRS